MDEYLEKAKKLRATVTPHYNCAQSVAMPFAEHAGIDEETARRFAANFGGGMKRGSVCGAVTGGLMVLGLFGLDDPQTAAEFHRRMRENHEGCLNCAELLRLNAETGGDKKQHCDAMVFEAVEIVEDILKRNGLSK